MQKTVSLSVYFVVLNIDFFRYITFILLVLNIDDKFRLWIQKYEFLMWLSLAENQLHGLWDNIRKFGGPMGVFSQFLPLSIEMVNSVKLFYVKLQRQQSDWPLGLIWPWAGEGQARGRPQRWLLKCCRLCWWGWCREFLSAK